MTTATAAKPKPVPCIECDGNGTVETWHPRHYGNWEMAIEVKCERCGGTGAEACVMCGETSVAGFEVEWNNRKLAHCSAECRDQNV